MKKKEVERFSWQPLIFVALVIIAVLIYNSSNDSDTFNFFNSLDGNTALTPEPNEDMGTNSYSVILDFNPSTICIHDSTTGSITTNINNGYCSIFFETPLGSGYRFFGNIILDANGDYDETQAIHTAGSANFAAVCCDASRNCKISNVERLTVNVCAVTPTPSIVPTPTVTPSPTITPSPTPDINFGYSSCEEAAEAFSKEFWVTGADINSLDECYNYASSYCSQFGGNPPVFGGVPPWYVTMFDYSPEDCCVWNCDGSWN